MMADMIEEEIFIVWQAELKTICKGYRCSYFDCDDKLSIASIGFIRAVRTYSPGFGKFRTYLARMISGELDFERLVVSRQRRVEQYNASLDRLIPSGKGATYLDCVPAPESVEMCVEVVELISLFEPPLRAIVLLLYFGYERDEIVRRFPITSKTYDRCLEIIWLRTREYLKAE